MLSIHRTIIATFFSAYLAVAAMGETTAQTADSPKPQTTADLAAEMARLLNESVVATRGDLAAKVAAAGLNVPEGPVVTYVSQGDTVEVRTEIKDPAGFASAKTEADRERVRSAATLCTDRWAYYLRRGVIIHLTGAASGGSDRFEFTVAQADCVSLYRAGNLADAKTLAEWAQAMMVSGVDLEPFRDFSWVGRLEAKVTAHEGTIEWRSIVSNGRPDLRTKVTGTLVEVESRLKMCRGWNVPISQGLAFHYVFVAEDGTVLNEYTIDRVSCLALPTE